MVRLLTLRHIGCVLALYAYAPLVTRLAANPKQSGNASGACIALPAATAPGFETMLEQYMANFCYQKLGWVHDPQVRTSDGVHPFVKVYYSPSLWNWLTIRKRHGRVPDGAMLVKEQYPSATGALDEWTILVKDSKGSFDGWYWADLSSPNSTAASPDETQTSSEASGSCAEASFPSVGFGPYCLNCHASAVNGQSTYATTSHVLGGSEPGVAPAFPPDDNIHHRLAKKLGLTATQSPASCLVPESEDHVVSPSRFLPRQHFLTSDQCTGCHDATGTLSPTTADLPRMLWPDALAPSIVNLSPNGEWRFSMMGLAGRDPIFFSQLASENSLHPNLESYPHQAKEFVQDLCLKCHGVMGERQYKHDTKQFFTRADLADANSQYGALARDGISCTVCHHISAEGLGSPSSFTGNFKLGSADELYGPFSDHVIALPMKNAIGVEPKATEENQITSSKLCGSCHTIILPVFDHAGRQVIRNGQPATFTEQATYLEWLNSSFVNQSCQDCHMPTTYKGSPLAYKIANIEDGTFPKVDFRAPDKDLALVTRTDYHRHTLLGINIFGLEMFRQFRTELGLYKTDPMLRSPDTTVPGIDTAIEASQEIASQQTAEIYIDSVSKDRTNLKARVRVVNLTGHSFPSGVGFRRAFVDFQVLDAQSNVVWESGATNRSGVIVDQGGTPLETEFFDANQQTFQKHHWMKRPIRTQNDVQIYEELAVNPEGFLTTSFIALDHKVKDNRLQPKGWSSSGPFAEETGPVGTCISTRAQETCDPDYQNGGGSNTVVYEIPLTAKIDNAASVRAALYYQSVPPYYLKERATDSNGLDTDRLVRFQQQLSLDGTPIEGWKLKIASAGSSL